MYRKRLSAYKSVGYFLSAESEGLFTVPKADPIFTEDSFEGLFYLDLSCASRSIFISCPRLKWRKIPRLVNLLKARMHNGVNVTIIVAETGNNEHELTDTGITIIQSPRKLNSAVIDGHIGWYGSVNFVGRSLPSSTAIRLDNPDFCTALIDTFQ